MLRSPDRLCGRRPSGRLLALVLLGMLALVMATPAPAQDRRVPESRSEVQLSFAPLVEKAAPAVVNIYARKIVRQRQMTPLFDDPFFRRFFGEFGFRMEGPPRQRQQNALGSGVIVRPDGLIVTNLHVIEGADEIRVVLADRREFDAEIVATDDKTDLAILRVDPGGNALPALELRDSDELKVGDLVLAIGNPFGVGQTVTSGIVSALSRSIGGGDKLRSFIQTDAAINPGNSGGALLSMDGRLIGINTAIFSKSGGSHGIGFAIPSNMVRAVIAGTTETGELIRPWLGATGQPVTSDIAESLGMARPMGVLVSEVYQGSVGWQAGLRPGDVILAVNGHEIDDPQGLDYRVATLAVGETAVFRVRRAGHTRAVSVRLAPPPDRPAPNETLLAGEQPLAGAVVANLSPAFAEKVGMDPFLKGVVVVEVQAGSIAARVGFRPGDIVRRVRGDEITRVEEIQAALQAPGRQWKLRIERDGRTMDLRFGG